MSDQEEDKTDGEWILNYVEDLIEEVKQYSSRERDHVRFHQKMAIKHQTFFAKFPHLLTKVCDDAENFDVDQLKEMLIQLGKIERGERDMDDVNKEMGKKYFDKFVSPHVDWDKEKKK